MLILDGASVVVADLLNSTAAEDPLQILMLGLLQN
jgi:hypothetical protein